MFRDKVGWPRYVHSADCLALGVLSSCAPRQNYNPEEGPFSPMCEITRRKHCSSLKHSFYCVQRGVLHIMDMKWRHRAQLCWVSAEDLPKMKGWYVLVHTVYWERYVPYPKLYLSITWRVTAGLAQNPGRYEMLLGNVLTLQQHGWLTVSGLILFPGLFYMAT